MRTQKQNQKGMTLIELIIVVALIGIIGATLVPTFSNMTTKARITSDISTLKTFQRQVDVFEAEFGRLPGIAATTAQNATTVTVEKALTDLIANDYMDTKYITLKDAKYNFADKATNGATDSTAAVGDVLLQLQTATDGATGDKAVKVQYDPEKGLFELKGVPAKYIKAMKDDPATLSWLNKADVDAVINSSGGKS